MATLTVSLPDEMTEFLEARVGDDFADTSEYLADLVRQDRERRIAALRRMVEEARASGISDSTMQDIREEGRRIARDRGLL
jgi:antitoxin ParD1/3/4